MPILDGYYMQKKSACFTGHRASKLPNISMFTDILSDCANDEAQALEVELFSKINAAIHIALNSGYRRFYQGGCDGSDIFASECLHYIMDNEDYDKDIGTIELYSIIPFKNHRDTIHPKWQARYDVVLHLSTKVITLSDTSHKGAYYERNRYMVDHSDLVIGFFNGDKTGGTRHTLNYAFQEKKNTLIVPL